LATAEAAPAEPVPPPPVPAPTPTPSPARRVAEPPAPVPKTTTAARPQPLQKTPAAPSAASRPATTAPAAAPPRRPAGGLDLDALAGQVSRLAGNRPGPATPSGGARSGPSAAALAGLQDQLQKLWNPNCGVEGGRDVRVRVSFGLSPAGDLSGPVEAGGLERSDNAVARAAAERAIRAVHEAAPFPDLASPAGQRIAVNFNAREACS
jgi:outer membrane biosynthesis protein TonB